ncbi:MAG TPA: DUF1127 domain-containing protein [Stellaceae bacterium]|jgi:uncharacterized protein YjiS (DUF1127 family)|nr:DUF1127 domain-containing protein [Stellaceae bacterium]
MDRVVMAVDSPLAEIGARVVVVVALLSCWRDRAFQRRQLARLDARQRADIGITQCDVAQECAKPFWRA